MIEPPQDAFKAQQVLQMLAQWLFLIAPFCGGAMLAYHAIMKSHAENDHMMVQHTKRMKIVIIGTVIAIGAGGLMNWFIPKIVPVVEEVRPFENVPTPECDDHTCTAPS